MHMVQKVFEGAFEFDVLFSSASAPKKITSEDLTQQIGSVTSGFASRLYALVAVSCSAHGSGLREVHTHSHRRFLALSLAPIAHMEFSGMTVRAIVVCQGKYLTK